MNSDPQPTPPLALRRWFVTHFVIDLIFALPLMIAPTRFLSTLGWPVVDPLSARLVAAALLGIGIESLLARHGTWETFRGMLNLKIIWSAGATLGIALSLPTVRSPFAWAILVVFVGFNAVWIYWRIVLRRLDSKRRQD